MRTRTTRTTGWGGPWLAAVDATGTARAVLLPAGQEPAWPRGTVKVAVRWRSPGAANPRKRTFTFAAAASAVQLARRVQVGVLLNQVAGPDGVPVDSPAAPVASLVTAGDVLRPAGVPAPEQDASGLVGAAAAAPQAAARDLLPPAALPLHLRVVAGDRAHWPARGGDLGPTVGEYVADLKQVHGPVWQAAGNTFMPGQLDLLTRFFSYTDGDPRAVHYGLAPGSSLHLCLLEPGDCAEALVQRRQVNLAAVRRNAAKQAKYQRAVERYQLAQGRPGRRPDLPTLPVYERAVRTREETGQDPAISAGSESHFATACAFVFDRAHDRRAFPGPNPWRVFNPRRNGGRAQQAPVIRRADPGSSTSRRWPGLGFFVDLGDALAERGAELVTADGGGARSGARYRLLPLIVTCLMLRPGEGVAARPEYAGPGTFEVTPLPGGHLKHRAVGQTRLLDASALTGWLIAMHAEAGFGSHDGYLFSGPAGGRLDVSNFTEDFLRPALRTLLSPGGLWDDHQELLVDDDVWYLMRKAGESILLAHGLDPATAARWAGHAEAVMYGHYKGEVASGRSRVWHGLDATVVAALSEQPPSGNGPLATMLRGFAGSSETQLPR